MCHWNFFFKNAAAENESLNKPLWIRRSRLIRFHHRGNLQARSASVKACGIDLVHVRARALMTEWWKSLFFRLYPTKQAAPICVVFGSQRRAETLQAYLHHTPPPPLPHPPARPPLPPAAPPLRRKHIQMNVNVRYFHRTTNASARRHLPSACSLEAWRRIERGVKVKFAAFTVEYLKYSPVLFFYVWHGWKEEKRTGSEWLSDTEQVFGSFREETQNSSSYGWEEMRTERSFFEQISFNFKFQVR